MPFGHQTWSTLWEIRPGGLFIDSTERRAATDDVTSVAASVTLYCGVAVMGIKGRRVHMIEELSDTIISFQRGTTTRPVLDACACCRLDYPHSHSRCPSFSRELTDSKRNIALSSWKLASSKVALQPLQAIISDNHFIGIWLFHQVKVCGLSIETSFLLTKLFCKTYLATSKCCVATLRVFVEAKSFVFIVWLQIIQFPRG